MTSAYQLRGPLNQSPPVAFRPGILNSTDTRCASANTGTRQTYILHSVRMWVRQRIVSRLRRNHACVSWDEQPQAHTHVTHVRFRTLHRHRNQPCTASVVSSTLKLKAVNAVWETSGVGRILACSTVTYGCGMRRDGSNRCVPNHSDFRPTAGFLGGYSNTLSWAAYSRDVS
jgi:hypothetical protein